jgi:hypothetical protein
MGHQQKEDSSADPSKASLSTQVKDSSREGIKTMGGPEPNVILDMVFLRLGNNVKEIW